MSLLPNSRVGKIEFYEAHVSPWQENAAAIGLTSQQVDALEKRTRQARAAYDAHQAAMEAAKAATLDFYNCVRDMAEDGADLIRTIRNQAETAGDPNVYVLARIPAPGPRSPTPPPGLPSDLRVALLATGALALSWKCPNPAGASGTIYEVQRRIDGENATFVYIGSSGVKRFTDETLPAGTASVTYQITAIRSTARGPAARFTVRFGVGGEGRPVVSLTPAAGAGGCETLDKLGLGRACKGQAGFSREEVREGNLAPAGIPPPAAKAASKRRNGRAVVVER